MEATPLHFYSQNLPNQLNNVNTTNSTTISNQHSRPPPSQIQSNQNQVQSQDGTSSTESRKHKGGPQTIRDYLIKVTDISKNHDIDSLYRPALRLCLEQADALSNLSPEAKQFSDKCFNAYWEWCNVNELKALPITGFIAALYLGNIPFTQRRNGFLGLEAYRHKCSQIFLNGSIIQMSGIVWSKDDINIWRYYVEKAQISLGLFDVIQDLLAVKGVPFQRPPGSFKLEIPHPPYTHRLSPKASTSSLAPPIQPQPSSRESQSRPQAEINSLPQPLPQDHAPRQPLVQSTSLSQSQARVLEQPNNISAPIISSTMSRKSNSNSARQDKGKGREEVSSKQGKESLISNPLPDVRSLLNPVQAKAKYELRKAALEITSKESVWNPYHPQGRFEECEFMRSIWNVEDILEQLDFVEKLEKEWLAGGKFENEKHALTKRFDPDAERDDNDLVMKGLRGPAVSQQAKKIDAATLSQAAFLAGPTKGPYEDYTPRSHFEGWTHNIVRPFYDLPIPLGFNLQSALTPFPISFVPSFFPVPPNYQIKLRTSAINASPSTHDRKLYPTVLPPAQNSTKPPAIKTVEVQSTSTLTKSDEASSSAVKIASPVTQPLPLSSPLMVPIPSEITEARSVAPKEMAEKPVEVTEKLVIENLVEAEAPIQKAAQIVRKPIEVLEKVIEAVSDQVVEVSGKGKARLVKEAIAQEELKSVEKSTESEVVRPAELPQAVSAPVLEVGIPSTSVLSVAIPKNLSKVVAPNVNGINTHKKDASLTKEIAIVVFETTVKKSGPSSKSKASTSTGSVKSTPSKLNGREVVPASTNDSDAAPIADPSSAASIESQKLATTVTPSTLAPNPATEPIKKKDKKRMRSASIDRSDQGTSTSTSTSTVDVDISSNLAAVVVAAKEERKARRKARRKEKKQAKAMLDDVSTKAPLRPQPILSSSEDSDQEVARRLAPTPSPSPVKTLLPEKPHKTQAPSKPVASTSIASTTSTPNASTTQRTSSELSASEKKRRRSPSPSSMVKQKWQHKTSSSTPFRPFG